MRRQCTDFHPLLPLQKKKSANALGNSSHVVRVPNSKLNAANLLIELWNRSCPPLLTRNPALGWELRLGPGFDASPTLASRQPWRLRITQQLSPLLSTFFFEWDRPVKTLPSGLACSPCVPSSLTAQATVQTQNDPHQSTTARHVVASTPVSLGRGICCIDQRQHDMIHCCHVNWTRRDSAADVGAVFARTESASSLAWRSDWSCATCSAIW